MMHKEIKEVQVDGVTKVLEEVVMTATKLGQQLKQGCGAVLTKSEHPSLTRSGDMDSLVKSCKKILPKS